MPARAVARPPRGDARRAILDAALALVRKQGWAATSVDELCRAARVTKGAFFHHFATKEALGIAAAQHWTDVTGPFFAAASFHALSDPLDRIFGYLALRAEMIRGPIEGFSCFAGTVVQESFATSHPLRDACGAAISDHAANLEADFREAMTLHEVRGPASAEGLARFTQTVLQGGFVLAKAHGGPAPVLEAIAHLEAYLNLLFKRTSRRKTHR
ncbi:MAG: TetR/AcrR family transcriptional regulator [Polyangiaceae bacterium]|nr:TetR/AcrR family transcriptional regulator [Polyangiaceae bacterium]